MRGTRYKALRCTISRGGFSDERVFSLNFPGGDYSGVASRRHIWTEAGVPVGEVEPPAGETLDGLVAARVLEVQDDGRVLVSVPDGEVVMVPAEQLLNRPAGVGEHVSI